MHTCKGSIYGQKYQNGMTKVMILVIKVIMSLLS